MKCFYYGLLLTVGMQGGLVAVVSPEEAEFISPLFSREKLHKISIRSIKKQIKHALDKYKRCLFTGPCTKKEMIETRQEAKYFGYAMIVIAVVSVLFKVQYDALIKAGETPVWWKFPLQYYELKKQAAKPLKAKIEKGLEKGKKILVVADDVVNGNTAVKIETPVGNITVALDPKSKKKVAEKEVEEEEPAAGWWSYLPRSFFPMPEDDEEE